MPNLIYRLVSLSGALGHEFPRESLQAAMQGRVDAIVCGGGSAEVGPYYLGTGESYLSAEAVKADYRHMVAAGRKIGCPVIVGSCGTAGGNRNLDWMISIAKEVFSELRVGAAKVGIINSELDPEIVIRSYRAGALRPIGEGPDLDEQALRESVIVGQMGVHPIITALEAGAKYILAGRACNAALFAADIIRRGIDAGVAYHVGVVLESGATACEPGSASDCLVAEIFDDGSAMFTSPNPARRCTAHSIAAHSLYASAHAQLRSFPEGILATENAQFFTHSNLTAGFRGSEFVRSCKLGSGRIKLEGARRLGARKVSLIHVDPAVLPELPSDVTAYGRNGVQTDPVDACQRELGIIIETWAATQESAVRLAKLLSHLLFHLGYAGRKANAGNVAFPWSPHLVSFQRKDGLFGAIVPSGTRDPAFISQYEQIKDAVPEHVAKKFPRALSDAQFSVTEAGSANPVVLLCSVDHDSDRLTAKHQREIDRIRRVAIPRENSRLHVDAPDAYAWSLYQFLQDDDLLRQVSFPIAYYRANGSQWTKEGEDRPRYFDIGEARHRDDLDERTLSSIADHAPAGSPVGVLRLAEMAAIIRSKNAGINRLTFDIIFASGEYYEAALHSNLFSKSNIARVLNVPLKRVIGTFFVDACNAIKISIDRPNIAASLDDRDVFGVQQHAALSQLIVPIHAGALSKASVF